MTTASIRQLGERREHAIVNRSTSLINVVIDDKPKLPQRLDPKVRGWERRFPFLLMQTPKPPTERRGLTHA
jgi:hypothetical protein